MGCALVNLLRIGCLHRLRKLRGHPIHCITVDNETIGQIWATGKGVVATRRVTAFLAYLGMK